MHRHPECRLRSGFTMIELLVVIVVLGLLISMIAGIAGSAIYQQKTRNTQQIMQNTMLAIETFATENPLRATYDRYGQETFGKYPPYVLANAELRRSLPRLLEGQRDWPNNNPKSLADRLYRDLSGVDGDFDQDWVKLNYDGGNDDGNNDNRSLYAYMRAFSPEALKSVPDAQLKPIEPGAARAEFINPTGGGTTSLTGTEGAIDVLGIHDAWGVPLDYMLYVKLEWGIKVLSSGQETPDWRVVERRPVLRSRGIKREIYDTWLASGADAQSRARLLSEPDDWIFTETLPQPWLAGLSDGPRYRSGRKPFDPASGSGLQSSGWVRMVGQAEDYSYRPDGDEFWP